MPGPRHLLRCFAPLLGLILAAGSSFAAAPVKVTLHPASGDTGTMHYAESADIQFGVASPVRLRSDPARGFYAPCEIIFTRALDQNSCLLLGWSSSGGGNETLHAMLVTAIKSQTVISDHLLMQVSRGAGAFLWSDAKGLFVLRPSEAMDGGDTFLESLQWTLDYRQMRQMKFALPPGDAIILRGGLGRMAPPNKLPDREASKISISHGKFLWAKKSSD